jgi:hypothetical protein
MLAELQLGGFGCLGGLSSLSSEKGDDQLLKCFGATGSVGISKEQVQQDNGGAIAMLLAREEICLSYLPTLSVRDLVDKTAGSLSVGAAGCWAQVVGAEHWAPGRQAVSRNLARMLGRYGRRRDKVR